jgi:hypothetical protein
MASTIKIKRSNVAGKTPTTSDIDTGEIALNIKDQKLYSSNGSSVFEIGVYNGGLVSTTTKTFDAIIGSDTVVTGVTAAVSTNYLQVANAATTYATKSNPTTSDLLAHTGRATISTNLAVSGNTTISGTLGVTGVATFAAGTALLPALTTSGDTNTGVWFPAADTVAASTAGTERMRIDSSGNVGIGTTPTFPLHVLGEVRSQHSAFPRFSWRETGGAADAKAWQMYANAGSLHLGALNDAENAQVIALSIVRSGYNIAETYHNSDIHLFRNAAGTERMRIDSSGNVGIGTSSPAAKLEVYSGSLGTSDGNQLEQARFFSTNSNGSSLRIFTERDGAGSDWETAFTRIQQRIDVTDMGYVQFNGADNQHGLSFGTTNTERMRIDSSGNVGIGTSSPGAKLDLTGGNLKLSGETSSEFTGMWLINTGSSASVYRGLYYDGRNENNIAVANMLVDVATDGSSAWSWSTTPAGSRTVDRRVDRMRIDSTGNVGIGTSSPAAKLDVNSGSLGTSDGNQLEQARFTSTNINGSYLRIFTERDGAGSDWFTAFTRIQQRIDATDMGYVQFNGADNLQGLSFGTTNTERMRIDSSGNVTINGSLTKGSGSFKIDHPLKPDTHHLVHSFVEAPTADNIYRGRVDLVDGVATVDIDEAARLSGGTFVALNTNTDCWVNNKTGWTAVRATVSGSILSIEAQDNSCADTVSWLVIGERHDQTIIDATWTDEAGRVITEPQKDH